MKKSAVFAVTIVVAVSLALVQAYAAYLPAHQITSMMPSPRGFCPMNNSGTTKRPMMSGEKMNESSMNQQQCEQYNVFQCGHFPYVVTSRPEKVVRT